MTKQPAMTQIALGFALIVSTQPSIADGFQLNTQSAIGLGRAFSGDAVIADNASAVGKNPATMALFKDDAFSIGALSVSRRTRLSNIRYFTDLAYGRTLNNESVSRTFVVPNLYYIHKMNDKWALGGALYSNFVTDIEFPDGALAPEYGGLTKIETLNFGLSTSYRLSEQWSLGAGVDFIVGRASYQRSMGQAFPELAGKRLIYIDKATGGAVGFNLGAVYELDSNTRFGFDYHHSPTLEVKDDYGQKMALALPDMAEFSGYHKVAGSPFAFHYSLKWIGWSQCESLKFSELSSVQSHGMVSLLDKSQQSDYAIPYDWQDALHFSLGGTYEVDPDWTLRSGVMLATSLANGQTSNSLVDFGYKLLSVGGTYHLSEHSTIDLGVSYLIGDKGTINESLSVGRIGISRLSAATRLDALLVGGQYNYQF